MVGEGEYGRALKDFERALQVEPDYIQARRNRQVALRRLPE